MARPLSIGTTLHLSDDVLSSFAPLRELSIESAQIFPPPSLDVSATRRAAKESGVEITSVIAHFDGESYADIPTVQQTVGLVPERTRKERVARLLELSRFGRELGVRQVQTHIGFVPDNPTSPLYAQIVETTRAVCDELNRSDQIFALETGQESAATLARFLEDVGRSNLRVNFDPANMILYGLDQPLAAMEHLFPWIESVHAKDGLSPTQSNQLGTEVPLGEGEVEWPRFGARLLELGFGGTLTIEREIEGEQKWRDVARAKAWLEKLVAGAR